MRKLICSGLAALTMSAASAAQVTSIQTANPAPKGNWNPNKIVCEAFETTGSRLGRRTVCKTALEWRDLTAAHREGVEELQRMGTSVGCQEGQSCVPMGPMPR
jgi:opacity protein-like surface antigen